MMAGGVMSGMAALVAALLQPSLAATTRQPGFHIGRVSEVSSN